MLCNVGTLYYGFARLSVPRVARLLGSRYSTHFVLRRKIIQQIQLQPMRRSISSCNDELKDSELDDLDEPSPYANVDVESIAGNDPDKIRDLKKCQLELDMMRQQGENVPLELTTENWQDILALENAFARRRFYRFLWLNEFKRQKWRERKKQLQEARLEWKANRPERIQITTSGPIVYSLFNNTIFFRIYEHVLKNKANLKLLYASMFNPHILVDCSYEQLMNAKNLAQCAKQIGLMIYENREHCNPFHIVLCNLDTDSVVLKKLRKQMPGMFEPESPFFHTSEHYLDLYAKDKLVYLTPHCEEELDSYNSEDIYIIGAFVDKCQSEPKSLAKAKRDGIRMAKFPLDKYLRWEKGGKALPLNHCLAIMNDLKETNDWKYALRVMPSRKIRTVDEDAKNDLNKLSTQASAKFIRDGYRHNIVYDLLRMDRKKQFEKTTTDSGDTDKADKAD